MLQKSPLKMQFANMIQHETKSVASTPTLLILTLSKVSFSDILRNDYLEFESFWQFWKTFWFWHFQEWHFRKWHFWTSKDKSTCLESGFCHNFLKNQWFYLRSIIGDGASWLFCLLCISVYPLPTRTHSTLHSLLQFMRHQLRKQSLQIQPAMYLHYQ